MVVKVAERANLIESEKKRMLAIRDFLRSNPGLAYSANELKEETGISCADNLLYYAHSEYAKKIGIISMNVVGEDGQGFCGSTRRYYCKPQREKRWWKFWA